ncbi:MAG: hypothetical protein F4X02_04840 [Chloroflexi bacterium]|nr:hypothetical protein [Chloroflexota bacterium]
MEGATILMALSLLGLGGLCAHQRRKLRQLVAASNNHDDEISQLRSRLQAAEQENLRSSALLSTYASVSFDAVILLDEDLRIVSLNGSAARLLESDSAVGRRLDEVINSQDLCDLADLARRETESLDQQLVIGDRNYRVRVRSVSPGGSAHFIGVGMQDITDLVHLNRARRDLVANISHELRTPITRIRLIIEGLFLDADKPKRKASIQSLKEIATETDALLLLAQELLDLSMIESGQAILRLVKTPLKQVFDEAIERLGSQAETKKLSIVSHVPQKLVVLCDADQLKRALGNLLHNAIKWSPPGDAVTITAAEDGDEVVVTVYDNGPGVADDVRERIFERFYQADVSHSGDEGAGLGLAICKHIIEAHGGNIWAEGNSQGKGGHFVFSLLKADADPEPAPVAGAGDERALEMPESANPA